MNRHPSFTELTDPQFWHRLVPEFQISQQTPLAEKSSFGSNQELRLNDWEICKELMGRDGYFAYADWFDLQFIDRLAGCFLALEEDNIPPIFAFVYDEFWELLLQLDPLLSDLIEDYELPAAIWAWLVREGNQTAFPPHRDQVRDAGVADEEHLEYLTIWIPLTDLNHLTSSICVLPASNDPEYGRGKEIAKVPDLQDIRCLQANRGSVFCWTTGLVHWGTKQTRFAPPRMSVGACAQHPDAFCFDPPLLDFYEPLKLANRLQIIGQQIINYSRQPASAELLLARQLAELV